MDIKYRAFPANDNGLLFTGRFWTSAWCRMISLILLVGLETCQLVVVDPEISLFSL